MSEENSPKITFKVRQKDQRDYKIPVGLSPEQAEAAAEGISAESSDAENAPDGTKMKSFEPIPSGARFSAYERRRSVFLFILLLLLLISYLGYRYIDSLNEKEELPPGTHSKIDLTTIDPTLLNPPVPDKEKVDMAIDDVVKSKAETSDASPEAQQQGLLEEIREGFAARADKEALSQKIRSAFARYPDNLEFHLRIIREAIDAKQRDFCYDLYRQWVKDDPSSYAANMIAAFLLAPTNGEVIRYLQNACVSSSSEPKILPYEKLLELYETYGLWEEARMVCEEMQSRFPDTDLSYQKSCEVEIYNGGNRETAYAKLERYASGKSPELRALILLPIAQNFMDESECRKLLSTPELERSMPDSFLYYTLRGALVFNRELDDSMLQRMAECGKCRRLLLLYYLSRKNFDHVLNITTPPDQYPDLEKVFLCWYNGNPSQLYNLAGKLLNRNSGRSITVVLLARFWMGDISAPQLRNNLVLVPTEDLGLVFTVLAEDAKRNGREKSAEVLYDKAAKTPRGIYSTMLEHYR